MSRTPPWRIVPSADREAWREAREARRQLLAKVRARRGMAMQREIHSHAAAAASADEPVRDEDRRTTRS